MKVGKDIHEEVEKLLRQFDISTEAIQRLVVYEELIYDKKATREAITDAIHLYSVT